MRDNFDFWAAEDARLAKAEEDLPKCDICGREMYEWLHVSYKLMDVRICEDCAVWETYEEE